MTNSTVLPQSSPFDDVDAASPSLVQVPASTLPPDEIGDDHGLYYIAINRIRRNTLIDPRRHRNNAQFSNLKDSVRVHGVMQPIIVRPADSGSDHDFDVVMGNSRFEASSEVHEYIPAVVRHVSVSVAAVMAGIENLQRQDLSPVEEGFHASRLLSDLHNDHDEVCRMLGWNRQKLNSRIMLTHVIAEAQDSLVQGALKIGHIELLATIPKPHQSSIMRKMIDENMSVADARERLKKATRQLKKAPFNASACSGCEHNSSTSADLFSASLGEGFCSNPTCWDEKVAAHIECVIEEARASYGTVHTDKTIAEDSLTLIEASGERGVGREQKTSCLSCQHYGAVVSTKFGMEGRVLGDQCFNLKCHAEMVSAYQQIITTDRVPATGVNNIPGGESEGAKPKSSGAAGGARTGKPGEQKGKPAPLTPATLKKGIKREAMKRFKVMGESAVNKTPSLGLAICLMTQYSSIVKGGKYPQHATETARAVLARLKEKAETLPSLGGADDGAHEILLLARLATEAIGPAMVELAALTVWEKDVFDHFEKHEPTLNAMKYSEVAGIESKGYLAVTPDYLKSQVKNGIINDCRVSGFAAAFDATNGEKAFEGLTKTKAAEMVQTINEFSEFDWHGYEPTGFSLSFYH